MRIGIYGAGQFCSCVNDKIPFIAVDGGIISLKKLNIKPTYLVGDFDSVDFNEVKDYSNVIKLPCKKDFSDTEVAIQHAIKLGYHQIDLYGVTGGRLDHFMTIMRLLVKYKSLSITIYDDTNKIYLLNEGKHFVEKEGYEYISFYAMKDTLLTLDNVEYPLNQYLMSYDCTLCLSNEIKGAKCYVENDHPIYCIQSKKGE